MINMLKVVMVCLLIGACAASSIFNRFKNLFSKEQPAPPKPKPKHWKLESPLKILIVGTENDDLVSPLLKSWLRKYDSYQSYTSSTHEFVYRIDGKDVKIFILKGDYSRMGSTFTQLLDKPQNL